MINLFETKRKKSSLNQSQPYLTELERSQKVNFFVYNVYNSNLEFLLIFSLQILSMGGNLLTEVPDTVGNLHQLQALVLCDNLISSLPTSIARCKNLKSLLLHKNRLRHLPKDIVALQNLTEVSVIDKFTHFELFKQISLISVEFERKSTSRPFRSGHLSQSSFLNGVVRKDGKVCQCTLWTKRFAQKCYRIFELCQVLC